MGQDPKENIDRVLAREAVQVPDSAVKSGRIRGITGTALRRIIDDALKTDQSRLRELEEKLALLEQTRAAEVDALEQSLSATSVALAEAKDEQKSLLGKVGEAATRAAAAELKARTAKAEVAKLEALVAERNQRLADLEGEIRRGAQRAAELENEISHIAQRTREDVEAQVPASERSVAEARAARDEAEARARAAHAKVGELGDLVARLEAERLELEGLVDGTPQREDLAKRLREAELQAERAVAELGEARATIQEQAAKLAKGPAPGSTELELLEALRQADARVESERERAETLARRLAESEALATGRATRIEALEQKVEALETRRPETAISQRAEKAEELARERARKIDQLLARIDKLEHDRAQLESELLGNHRVRAAAEDLEKRASSAEKVSQTRALKIS